MGLELSSSLLNHHNSFQKVASIAALTWSTQKANAVAANNELPMLAPGVSGKMGCKCVNCMLQQGCPCIAMTWTGNFDCNGPTAATANLLSMLTADVTDCSSLQASIGWQPLHGVIHTTSASKKGGTTAAVNQDGVIAAAEACVAANVPQCAVLISQDSRHETIVMKTRFQFFSQFQVISCT